MNEIKLDTIEIDGKEYFLVDTLKDNKNTYNYFANTLDKEDIYVLKDKKEIYKGKAEDAPKEIKNMQYNKIGFEGVDVIIEI